MCGQLEHPPDRPIWGRIRGSILEAGTKAYEVIIGHAL